MATPAKAQASSALAAVYAKVAGILPDQVIASPAPERPLLLQIFVPQLPPLLAPVPGLCRLMATFMLAPIIFICFTDLLGYTVFRTLGYRRRRVRVKREPSVGPLSAGNSAAEKERDAAAAAAAAFAEKVRSLPGGSGADSPNSIRAPLLTPGAYDADTLLRHRVRSISGDSIEAEEEWARTGGHFARVSTVRASKEAKAAAEASKPSSFEQATGTSSTLVTSPSDERPTFAWASSVGVEGALGYSDTDADDSGPESGRNSPEIGRRPWRHGFSFTPVDEQPPPRPSGDRKAGANASSVEANTMESSASSSWVGLESGTGTGDAAAVASDLEPSSSILHSPKPASSS